MDLHMLSHELPIWRSPVSDRQWTFLRRILISKQARASPLPGFATHSGGVIRMIVGIYASPGGRCRGKHEQSQACGFFS